MHFLTGMGMVTVMMSTTMKPATLMEEIAVDLMSIQKLAHYVNALKREEEGAVLDLQYLLELQLMEAAFRFGLEMAIAKISTTI